MKKCPTCDRIFDDSLKFCQIDGTPLVSAEQSAPEDSFKTMVGSLISDEDDASLNQTNKSDSNFSSDEPFKQQPVNNPPASPFGDSGSSGFGSSSPQFKEPEISFNQSPFGNPSPSQNEWAPPPAPISEWQNQNFGANTPFQPPAVGQGEDKTLAIVSLVCGILSVTCCGAFTGIVALITGFMAKNNVDANPDQYGGRGMALAGMILGGISIVLTVLWLVFVVIGGALS